MTVIIYCIVVAVVEKTARPFSPDRLPSTIVCDILKIDVENNEDEIFKAPDFKDVAGKIDFIIGEHLKNLQGLFENYGFTARVVEGTNNIIYER